MYLSNFIKNFTDDTELKVVIKHEKETDCIFEGEAEEAKKDHLLAWCEVKEVRILDNVLTVSV